MRSQHTHSNKGGSGETRAGWMTAAGMAGEVLMVRRAKGDHPEELRWQADLDQLPPGSEAGCEAGII